MDADPKADPPAPVPAQADPQLAEANARIMRLGEEINSLKKGLEAAQTRLSALEAPPPPPRKPGIFKPRRVS